MTLDTLMYVLLFIALCWVVFKSVANTVGALFYICIAALLGLIIAGELKENNVDTNAIADKGKEIIKNLPDIEFPDLEVNFPTIEIDDGQIGNTGQGAFSTLFDALNEFPRFPSENSEHIPIDIINTHADTLSYTSINIASQIKAMDGSGIYSHSGKYLVQGKAGIYTVCINDALYQTNWFNYNDMRKSVSPAFYFSGSFEKVRAACPLNFEVFK